MKSLLFRDAEAVWHPFSPLNDTHPLLPIVRGEGALLFDEQGKRYIDGISSWWVNIHGHAHPYITAKLTEQLHKLHHVMFAGVTHEPAVKLAEKLLSILPAGYKKIFYSDDGSTAVEVALKIALQYWWNRQEERSIFVSLEEGYHGDTFGAMAVGGRGAFAAPFAGNLFKVLRIPRPVGDGNETVKQLKALAESNKIAAFIYEPLVQGSHGMKMYDRTALKNLLAACQRLNIITIADEVMTGFGRTGALFASEYAPEIAPDIICLSKGLTGGTLPLGATAVKNHLLDPFLSEDRRKMFFHGHSFTANPLACTAALASIELLLDPECGKRRSSIAEQHKVFLGEIAVRSNVKNTRLCGTIAAFDVFTEGEYFSEIRDKLYLSFINKGVLLRPLGNTVYIMPPYCIADKELAEIYNAIRSTLDGL
jgi:adenosylmethionine-8-amino-7-oxononanoate aminotransferase